MFAHEAGCGAKRPPQKGGARQGLIAIVTAMPEEFEAIAMRVSNRKRLRVGKLDRGLLLRGRISGAPVLLAMTGDGVARAFAFVSHLLGEFPVSLLVGAGAAGALVPALRAGEIVVAKRLVDEEGDVPAPAADRFLHAVKGGAKPGTIVTLSKLICSSKEKGAVAARFGLADPTPAVVDTESAAWARAAASRGVPCLIVRAVSDTFEEDLPDFLSSCLSPEGSVDRAAVARRLLLHPGSLRVLLRARERVREGAAKVGLFLEKLLSEKI